MCKGCSREIVGPHNKVWCSQACHMRWLRRFSESPGEYLLRIGLEAVKDGEWQI